MKDREMKSWLSNEWRFIISVISPIVALAMAWGTIQTKQAVMEERLNKISDNELVHVQASLNRIEEQYLNLKIELTEIKTSVKK